ncbi:MAG: InlB B-repeat-containing protein [Actinomycetes bacterium]|nr:InlB B-repeat-containing protein [Actinomycetes bacterium]
MACTLLLSAVIGVFPVSQSAYAAGGVQSSGLSTLATPTVTHNVTFVLDSGGSTNPALWQLYTAVGSYGVMQIADGDPITEPQAPSVPADMVTFRGWSIYDPNNGGAPGEDYERTDFWGFDVPGSPDVDVVTDDVVLFAVFTDRYLVSFKTDTGTIFQTRYIYMDPDYKTVDKRSYTFAGPDPELVAQYVNTPDNTRLMYWYKEGDPAQNPVSFGTVTVTEDTVFVPSFSAAKLVLFNSQGGSTVDPQFPLTGQTVDRPSNPTRPGYTFAYWSTDKNAAPADQASKEFRFNDVSNPTTVAADVTLYAVWQANSVGYTIVYWVEKANLGRTAGDPATAAGAADYDYYSTYPVAPGSALSLAAGTTPNFDLPAQNALLNTTVPFPHKVVSAVNNAALTQDIHYAEYRATVSPALAGDGTTVVNVYFTRRLYTFQFDMKVGKTAVDGEDYSPSITSDAGGYISRAGTTWQLAGGTYPTTLYSFQAKLGDNISDRWPMYAEALTTSTNYKLYGWIIGNWNSTPHNDITEVYDWMCAAAERDGGTATYSNDGAYVLTIAPEWQTTGSSYVAHCRLYYIEYLGSRTGITFIDITDTSLYTISQNPGDWPRYITYNGQYYELAYGQNGYQTSNTKAQFASLEGVIPQYNNGNTSILHAGLATRTVGATIYTDTHFSASADHVKSNSYGGYTWTENLQYIFFLYARNSYNLDFNMGGATGALPATLNGKPVETTVYGGSVRGIEYGESLAAYNPGTPARAGYEFAGWYTTSDFSSGSEFSFTIEPVPTLPAAQPGSVTALTLYAKWTPSKYTVRFYDGIGGTHLTGHDIKVGEGDTINDPGIYSIGESVPGKGEFTGWVWLVAGTWPVSFGFGGQAVTGDLNLYATWKTTGFTVVYDANGGTGTVPTDSKSYVLNELARVLDGSNLTRMNGTDEQVFYGWNSYVHGSDGISWMPQTGAVLSYAYNVHRMTGDTQLVAFYGDKTDSVKYIYHPVIADAVFTGTTSTAVDTPYWYPKNQTVGYDYAIALFAHDKKDLIGWDTDPAATTVVYTTGQAIADTGNVDRDLYAVWQTKQYELRFVAGTHGSITGGAQTVPNVPIDTPWNSTWVPTSALVVPDAGYHFVNWTPAFPSTVVLNQTFTANFAPNIYRIVYDYGTTPPAGATALPTDAGRYYYAGAGTPDHITVASDAAAPGSGYDFEGWKVAGTDVSGSVAIAGIAAAGVYDAATGTYVITLTGSWVATDQVLTYRLNEPAGTANRNSGVATETVKTAALIRSAAHYTDSASDPAAPTLTGYVFGGWYLDAACTTAVGNTTMPAGGRSIYAKWTPQTGVVIFDANTIGYTGMMSNQSFEYNELKNLSSNTYAKPGYTFAGWSTTSAGQVVYSEAGAYRYNPDPYAASITLYAVWLAGTNTPYTVQHYLVGADGTATLHDTDTLYGTTGDGVTAAPKTLYTGYTYAQGYSNGADYEVASGYIAGDGSLTLKLYYAVNRHRVSYAYTGTPPVGVPALPADHTDVAYGSTVTVSAPVPTRAGYVFHGWLLNDEARLSFTMPDADVQLQGYWTARNDTAYTIDYYYQNQVSGLFTHVTGDSRAATGTTDTMTPALLTGDYVPRATSGLTYTFDAANPDNVLSGVIAGDGSLHLRVYFKLQFTVSYLPGTQGTWMAASETYSGLDWGSASPTATVDPTTAHEPGYYFSGWNQAVDALVVSDRSYEAMWTPSSGVTYTVEHYLVRGTTVTMGDRDEFVGTTNQWVTAPEHDYPGYLHDPLYVGTHVADYVAGDGSLVLVLFYVARTYTVTFVDWDGGTIQVQPGLFYGDAAAAPAAPVRDGYSFVGWDVDFSVVTTDLVVRSIYKKDATPPVDNGTDSDEPPTGTTTPPKVPDREKLPTPKKTQVMPDTGESAAMLVGVGAAIILAAGVVLLTGTRKYEES